MPALAYCLAQGFDRIHDRAEQAALARVRIGVLGQQLMRRDLEVERGPPCKEHAPIFISLRPNRLCGHALHDCSSAEPSCRRANVTAASASADTGSPLSQRCWYSASAAIAI